MYRHLCTPLLLVALGLSPATVLHAADAEVVQVDEALQSAFGGLPLVEEMDGNLRWGGADGFVITSQNKGQAVVETDIGLVTVRDQLIGSDDAALISDLRKLARLAAGAGIEKAADKPLFTYRINPVLGSFLYTTPQVIWSGGVLNQVDGTKDQHAKQSKKDSKAVSKAVGKARKALDDLPKDDLAIKAIDHVLGLLDQQDTKSTTDEINPAYARRVLRAGWAETVFGPGPVADALKQAVLQASSPRAAIAYEGDGASYRRLTDAFGQGAIHFSHPGGQVLSLNAPLPMYHWPMQDRNGFQQARVVLDLPADVDPIAEPAKAMERLLGAKLVHDGTVLASWTATDGFVSDMDVWRSIVPAKHRRLDSAVAENYLPPHIVITDLKGDTHGILVPNGKLIPARDNSDAEIERFLADSASLLPDADYLDLISQYLFKYVYDSPDPEHPLLLGNRNVKSDIHQTAVQTVSTVTGGVCRGDCDDLSELLENIVERQGKTAHVISLPAHAAVAWAEQKADKWHVFVMQTGPTLEFVDDTLQEALRQAYQSFDASDAFDPNGLGLLLRFSGENTRSGWRLSWRIFSEPDYAETMINVQKDWHYQTYLQGINKMLAMIDGGDEDTANYRELSGLYSFTGQYESAAQYHGWAIERTPEPDSKALMEMELIGHLLDAGKRDEAIALFDTLIGESLPKLSDSLGHAMVQIGLQLSVTLSGRGEGVAAARALGDLAGNTLVDPLNQVAGWAEQRFAEATFDNHPFINQTDRLLSWQARAVVGILESAKLEDIVAEQPDFQTQVDIAKDYIEKISFLDAHHGDELAQNYELVGSWMVAEHGLETVLEKLENAAIADDSTVNHRKRVSGEEQAEKDLAWIKASIPFYTGELAKLFDQHRPGAVDIEVVKRIGALLDEAEPAARKLDLVGPRIEHQLRVAKLTVAIVDGDDATIREVLEYVKRKDDKRLRDDVAQWIGDTARAISTERFEEVLGLWQDVLDYKPKYYWIAWRAALNHAPEKAVIAAEMSAKRFADDPAFVEEAAFMKKLLSPH